VSKRMEKSNEYAQLIAREIRYQLANHGKIASYDLLLKLVDTWMHTTGEIKYQRPSEKNLI